MSKKVKCSAIVIILLPFLISSLGGCKNTSEVQELAQVEKSVKEAKSLIIPQYELIETPKYKELKQKVETVQADVNKIEVKRARLLTMYTEEYVSRQRISKDLKEAERKLTQLKTLLNAEEEKLERRIKNPLV